MARKTILVCDNCGVGSRRGKGRRHARHVQRRAPRREGGRPLRRLRGHDARQRRRAARPQAEVARRSQDRRGRGDRLPRPPLVPHFAASASRVRKTPQGPDYDGLMGLSLVVGPAHAGKVALLLDRFVDALDRDPWLIVPNRVDVDRVERELAARCGALLAGTVGHVRHALRAPRGQRVPRRGCSAMPERGIVLRHLVARSPARRARAVVALRRVHRLARRRADRDRGRPARSGRSRPRPRGADARLPRGARTARRPRPRHGAAAGRRAADDRARRLERRAGLRVRLRGPDRRRVAPDRGARRRAARCTSRCRTSPAGPRSPRSPGRPPTSLRSPAATSSSCRAGSRRTCPGLAHLERHLFDDSATPASLDGSIRFLEGAGRRATLELVAETVLDLVRDGIAPEEIAVVCPSLERTRASIETAFGALGVPVAIEAPRRLGATAFGQSLLSLLRFAWSNGTRRDLFAFLRTPYGGLGRADVDFLEGRLRGRAVLRGDRTLEEMTKLRTGRPLPMLELLDAEDDARRRGGRGRVDAAQRLRARAAPTTARAPSVTSAPPTPPAACSTSCERLCATPASRSRPTTSSRRSTGRPCGATPRASRAASPCST